MPLRTCQRLLHVGLSAVLAATLSACIKTDHLLLGQDRYPPRPEHSPVEFLADLPSRPFTKIAMVEAVGRSTYTAWEELREALGEEAGKIGADAVMELKMGGNLVGALAGGPGFVGGGVGERNKLTGVAIRYK